MNKASSHIPWLILASVLIGSVFFAYDIRRPMIKADNRQTEEISSKARPNKQYLVPSSKHWDINEVNKIDAVEYQIKINGEVAPSGDSMKGELIDKLLETTDRSRSIQAEYENMTKDSSIVKGFYDGVKGLLEEAGDDTLLEELQRKFDNLMHSREDYKQLIADEFSEEEIRQLQSLASSVSHIVRSVSETVDFETTDLTIENQYNHIAKLIKLEEETLTAERRDRIARLDDALGESAAMIRSMQRAAAAIDKAAPVKRETSEEMQVMTRKNMAVKYRDIDNSQLDLFIAYLSKSLVKRESSCWRHYEDKQSSKVIDFMSELTKIMRSRVPENRLN